MPPIISADNLVKEYDGVRALDRATFDLEQGDLFALVGPNGAGKTTLLRLLTDILKPDSGTLRLFGSADLRGSVSRVGYMPEERGLYKNQSALDTVGYFAELRGIPRRDAKRAAQQALDRVGMGGHAKRKVEELSKGMSQRVQFAATIAHDPDLLILDEPFSGLDPVSSRDIQQVILEMHAFGKTVLLSTHNMEHAEKLCQKLLMLHRGEVRLYGRIGEIKDRYLDRSLEIEHRGELPDLPHVRLEHLGDGKVRLHPEDSLTAQDVLKALVDGGADIVRFEPVVPTLEDIFIRVAGAGGAEALRETQAATESFVI
jgi:ABC-2 type transport system ATP-binding protein